MQPANAPYEATSIDRVLSQRVVISAIPGGGLVEVAKWHSALDEFGGTFVNAALDLRIAVAQRLMPKALVVRIAPFLLPGHDDISNLAFAEHKSDRRWRFCLAILELLGSVDMVDDETAYDVLLTLGSPFPIVLRRGLSEALAETIANSGMDAGLISVAERLLWRALVAIGLTYADVTEAQSRETVATPGGITEKGLLEIRPLTSAVAGVLAKMLVHAEGLRDRYESLNSGV